MMLGQSFSVSAVACMACCIGMGKTPVHPMGFARMLCSQHKPITEITRMWGKLFHRSSPRVSKAGVVDRGAYSRASYKAYLSDFILWLGILKFCELF